MDFTVLGRVTDVRLVQSRKALYPMDVTLLPKVMEERLEQRAKA